MASLLKVLLDFLRIVRLTRDRPPQCLWRWVSLLAVLGRKFRGLWRFGLAKLGTLRKSKPPERLLFGREESTCPVCGNSAISRGYIVAASTVPESANYPNTQERAARQTATTAPAFDISPTHVSGHSVDHPRAPNPPPPPNTLGTINTQGSGSDRSSVITSSDEETHAPVGPRSQSGRRLDPSRSRHRLSKPASLTNALQPLHSEITDLAPLYHGDRIVNPMVQSSMSSHIHESLALPPMDENRRNMSSTSLVFNFQDPSTESLPISSSTNPEASIHSVATLVNFLPEGRSVQLINSDQVPRYTKNITMQVGYIVILLRFSHLLADPVSRRRTM